MGLTEGHWFEDEYFLSERQLERAIEDENAAYERGLRDGSSKTDWINVKDRLPKENGKYLIFHKSCWGGIPHAYIETAWFLTNLRDNPQFKYEGRPNKPGFYNGDSESDWVESNVTHWMPLPKPPEEDTTNENH